ncbi:caspase family protein [Cesiribacter andamanensis]|uniref:Uncharacterized protein n=1 Tax=Cesiribacter andamanensis AMV16 TaxID=1279009 RepID=M7N7K7_9BACT|nr:caspase family protein [Cesiribacter andamanensis]EMR03216.1 putative protein containing caspase domain protein [Cesiribacter andamanensis AMV16]
MKYLLTALFSCLLLGAQAQNKHALIVAVGDYDPSTGWGKISSLNDIDLIKSALQQQGFKDQHIKVITDAQATRAGIVKELQDLKGRVKPTDIVMFHFSGHGQQIMDDNGDEFDGFDEALVPYDAPKKYIKGVYEGENHLRDEVLGGLLDGVREKVGKQGELLVVIDACHSGTGTRGLAVARGTQEVLAPEGYNPQNTCTDNSCNYDLVSNKPNLAPMICYFGASPHELNFETFDEQGRGVGSLSWAFAKAMSASGPNTTHKSLFDRIKLEMAAVAPRQTPQIEGNMNVQVFQGKTVTLPQHYTVLKWLDDKNLTLSAGTLLGLNEGSEITLYPMDTRNLATATPLGKGTVSYADMLTADVSFDKPIAKEVAQKSWAFVTSKNHGKLEVSVKLDMQQGELYTALTQAIKQRPFIKVVSTNPDLVIDNGNAFARGEEVQVMSAQDHVLYRQPVQAVAVTVEQLITTIHSVAQAKFLKNMESRSDNIALEMEMIPVTVRKEGRRVVVDKTLDPASKRDATGNLVFKEGDYFQIRVKSTGYRGAYFSILDFTPENEVSILVPGQNRQAQDYFLKAGETKVLPEIFQLGAPYGTEVFKLISTEQPMDLSSILVSRGENNSRNSGNPFEALFKDSFKSNGDVQHRSAATTNVPPDAVHIQNAVFTIKPNN